MNRDNINCYRNILAIDPGYSFKNGAGIAIFDHETYRLKACELIRPFAPGLEDHRATIEIAEKARQVWEKHVGFSFDPDVLCIEFPRNCFARNGYLAHSKSIIMLGILCARIESKFSAQIPLRPNLNEWKGNHSKEDSEEYIHQNLCIWSKKVLSHSLASISKHLHHHIYDAVGLGLWAIKKKKNLK